MENEKKPLLPVGTIVMLKDGNKKAMILGRYRVCESGSTYDYEICAYPEGFDAANQFFADNEDINEIYALGYYDEHDEKYINDIKTIVSQNNINVDGVFNSEIRDNPSNILPIGSVVHSDVLEDCYWVISGYVPIGKDDNVYDYLVFTVPDGGMSGCLNHEQITEVLHQGYIDKECHKLLPSLEYSVNRIKYEHGAGLIKPDKVR